jgi:Outer membrane protein beta-barrel domain
MHKGARSIRNKFGIGTTFAKAMRKPVVSLYDLQSATCPSSSCQHPTPIPPPMRIYPTSFVTIGALFLPSLLLAQFELRPHAGLNVQNLNKAPETMEWTGLSGFQFGAHAVIGNSFYVQPGVQFAVTRTELSNVGITLPDFAYELTSRSLRIPLLLGFRLADPENDPFLNLRIFLGPTAVMDLKTDWNEQNAPDFQLNDTQWKLGGGVGLDVWNFFFDASYDVGMNGMFREGFLDAKPKADMLSVNAGLRLRLAH